MRGLLASSTVPRTTINLDASVLRALRRRAAAEGKSLGDLASELLAPALRGDTRSGGSRPFHWLSAAMRPKLDLEDGEAVWQALENR